MAISKVILNGETLMDTTDKTVTSASMLSGTTALKNDGTTVEGSIATKTSSNLTASGATITAPAGYYASSASKSVATTTHPNPTASINSSTGLVTASHTQTTGYVTGGTTTGTVQLTTQAAKTVTPTESEQTAVAAGRYTTGAIKVGAIPSTYVGSGVTQNDSGDLTVSGATVTVPMGYYAESASASVASGTAGTPTAIKGAVSNNSVSVTPSVTNTTGYITGGTKSGTAVTVSASELVSGTKSISAAGETDVTNYEKASVSDGSATTPTTTITANPTISVSTDGLITASVSGSKSVTPTVRVGYVSNGTAGTVSVSGSKTEQLTAQAAQTIHPSTIDQTISSGQYLTGTQTVKGVVLTNLTAENIKKDVVVKVGDSTDDDCVASVIGTLEGSSGGMSEADLKRFIERSSNFKDIDWPDGITIIGSYAFGSCAGFNSSSLPSTVTKINQYAFYGCDSLALTSLPSNITTIEAYAFQSCSSLALTSLPSNITRINNSVFYGCYNLDLTSLPSKVTYIGSYAFSLCEKIASISCDGAITTVGSSAFIGSAAHPMSITRVSFPNMALTSNLAVVFGSSSVAANACQQLAFCDIGSTVGIAANAFANCYALQTLVLRKTSAVCTLANVSAFLNTPMRGYNSLTGTVYVPSALISDYQTATNWSTLYNNGTVTFAAIEGSEYEL